MRILSVLPICAAIAVIAPMQKLRAQDTGNTVSEQTVGQSGTFSTGGDTIFYRMAGTGPAMLLIHGFPLSGKLFRSQLAALSQSHTVITPDLPGFGESVTGRADQTDKHYAKDMFALLTHLGVQKAVIGGHSMGGQVALEMYRQQPTRFAGMILFDTNPAAASIVEMAQWPAYGRQAEKMGSASIAPPVLGVMVTGAALAKRPDLGTAITDIVSAASPEGVVGGGHALATRPDYSGMLAQIIVPTIVICGQDDPVYPLPVSVALSAGIPNSTLTVVPAAAHASMFQRPEMVDQAIENWAGANGV